MIRFRNEKSTNLIGGLLLSIILITFMLAATAGKNNIWQDCFMKYDLYVAGETYRGSDTSSDTNFWYLVTETVPSASTDTEQNYCVKADKDWVYLCVTNDHFGSGTNWIRWSVTNSW